MGEIARIHNFFFFIDVADVERLLNYLGLHKFSTSYLIRYIAITSGTLTFKTH